MVRSQLEYANCIWRPYKRGDIEKLERVQRRATKCIKEIAHLPYKERLISLGLPSLEYRRLRGDMIQTYKILNNIDNLDPKFFFERHNDNRTRGHSYKLKIPFCRLNVRKYCFSVRVVSEWNSLTEEIVTSPSINCFKNRLDKFWIARMYIF